MNFYHYVTRSDFVFYLLTFKRKIQIQTAKSLDKDCNTRFCLILAKIAQIEEEEREKKNRIK